MINLSPGNVTVSRPF